MFRVNNITRNKNLLSHGFGPDAMKMVTVCPECGSLELTGRHRCSKCGEKLPRLSLFEEYKKQHRCCSRCGTVLSDRMAYCTHCGMAVNNLKVI